MTVDPALARMVWQFGEPIHAVTYFSPETRRHTDRLGLKGGWMSYFGCRAAPLGPAPPEVVGALFYNFHPRMVARALPDAWSHASPERLLDARLDAMDEALRRLLGDAIDADGVQRAAVLARQAVECCEIAGRALGGANAAITPGPVAHLSLWQSLTTMREYRGDGHVAALVEAEISPCEALVLQSATGRSDPDALRVNRGWTEAEWTATISALRAKGWLDPSGAITNVGRTIRDGMESTTDRLSTGIVEGIGSDGVTELVSLLQPLAEAVMGSGTVTPLNNMGLPWPPPAG